jgi:hypothetical protein
MAAPVGTAAVPALPEPAGERCNFPAGRGTQLYENHSGSPQTFSCYLIILIKFKLEIEKLIFLLYSPFPANILLSFQFVSYVKFTDSLM